MSCLQCSKRFSVQDGGRGSASVSFSAISVVNPLQPPFPESCSDSGGQCCRHPRLTSEDSEAHWLVPGHILSERWDPSSPPASQGERATRAPAHIIGSRRRLILEAAVGRTGTAKNCILASMHHAPRAPALVQCLPRNLVLCLL